MAINARAPPRSSTRSWAFERHDRQQNIPETIPGHPGVVDKSMEKGKSVDTTFVNQTWLFREFVNQTSLRIRRFVNQPAAGSLCGRHRTSAPVYARRGAGTGAVPCAGGGGAALGSCRPTKDRQPGGEGEGAAG